MNLRFCEGDSHTLSCPYFATKINILYANYGRLTGAEVCGWGGGNKNCRAAGALAKVQARCQGLSRCTLLATNTEFGDPCKATYKYLEVTIFLSLVSKGYLFFNFSLSPGFVTLASSSILKKRRSRSLNRKGKRGEGRETTDTKITGAGIRLSGYFSSFSIVNYYQSDIA